MNVRNGFGNGLRFFLIAFLFVPWVNVVPGSGAAPTGASVPSEFPFDNLPVFSDFDGDNKLDCATLSSNGALKNINLAFGKSSWRSLSFDSDVFDRGMLVSGDIDEDGHIDLVWISQTAGKFVAWLGDGRGNFSVDTDSKFDFDRIQALLGNSGPGFADHGNGPEPMAVSLSTSFIVPDTSGSHPHLDPQASLLTVDTPVICLPCLAVLQLRGPPEKLV